MQTARWLCLAAANAAFWNSKKPAKDTRSLPHVVNGLYDTSWHARNVSSWSDVRTLAPRDSWTAALVVAADDVETPCDDTHDQCATWAEGGECDANPGYMLRSCRKSCDTCAPCGAVDAQSLLVSLRHAQRNRPARFLATGIARRTNFQGAWPFPGGDACGAFLVGPGDAFQAEAP